ncbi:type II toxin-antitoxin system RelE/ParE family toxin [Janthinobacterium sp.]|uniref:type II toxin-antitoxin system RelE/ParE family toxin n=1 Tax=Janthinobacterium sp. TaxID=1871054 RepID=UPI002610AB7B|nr:type II toxin-antitoxin system RelE/ParE family toxin [Janthinobacterium sp.]
MTSMQDQLLASADVRSKLGPAAGRPLVGSLKNARHPNMKELRFKARHGAEVWRAAFAFDPMREAVMLVAAAKQGVNEEKFYRDLLAKANERYDRHVNKLNAMAK